MKVLVVANHNSGHFATFVMEQADALRQMGVEVEMYGIVGRGIIGYLRNVGQIKKKIREFNPDLIHAHYGLSGLCANLQRGIPVVTTYHGSDIHSGGWVLQLSQLTMRLSAYNIFVSEKLLKISMYRHSNTSVLSCGVCLETFKCLPRSEARRELGLNDNRKIVLFSGTFDNVVKNYPLARDAMNLVPEADLIELKGYSREEVNLLMNACNALLTTSYKESGPLVVKEAMACGTPVVSVDVGDVVDVVGDTDGCYIAKRNAESIAQMLRRAIAFRCKTMGRQRIICLGLDNREVAKRLLKIYEGVVL